MRIPTYHSPSSIKQWKTDRREYYIRYLAENRPPRPAQTLPMAVGSAFDAYVKAYLYQNLFGRVDGFGLNALLEQQVEAGVRAAASEAGGICFGNYKTSGALSDLMSWLTLAYGEPRFETTVQKTISHRGHSTVLMGKPDLYFQIKAGINVILDWKVNGYCSSASPTKGYMICRPDGKIHKLYKARVFEGVTIGELLLEQASEEWALQLCIYGWLCGAPIGSDVISCIDQLAWRNGTCRVASHRGLVGREYQESVWDTIIEMDQCIKSGCICDGQDMLDNAVPTGEYADWWNNNVR